MSTPSNSDLREEFLPITMGIGVVLISWCVGAITHNLPLTPKGALDLHAASPAIWLVDLFPVLLVWARRQQVALWQQAAEVRHLKRRLEEASSQAQEASLAHHTSAADLLAAVHDGLFRVDGDGNIVDANEAAAILLGVGRNDLMGMAMRGFLPHLDLKDPNAVHTRRTSQDDAITTEWFTPAVHASGQRFPAVVTASPIPVQGSMGLLVALRDEGQQQAKLDELERTVERRMVARNATGSTFDAASVAHMNHSLRTPLAAILGYAELLGEHTREKHHDELTTEVARIEYAGRELLKVLDNLTDLSLEQAGQLHLTAEDVKLSRLIDHAVIATRPLASQRNNRVEFASSFERLTLLADPQRTRRVLINLLARAHSATQNGVIGVKATRTSLEGQPLIAIEISDNGTAMTPEEIIRHLDQSTGEGARLGLWLCRRLARRMGGDLDILPVDDDTTRVVLTLPTPLNPTLIPSNALSWSPPSGPQQVKLRALLIGMRKDALAAARGALPDRGWVLETCDDPESAPAVLRDMKPDLMLVGDKDAMGTWRLLDKIRRDPMLSQSPVVLVSAHPDPRRAWRARLPVSPPETGVLQALVTRILERGGAPRVVVAEANVSTAADLAIALRLDGCAVTVTHDTDDALDLASTRVPDLIVLGPNPGRGPSLSQVLAAIRAEPATRDVPIMVSPASLLSADDAARLQQFRHAVLQPSDLRNGDRVRKLAQTAMGLHDSQ